MDLHLRRLIWISPSLTPREERQDRFIQSLRVDPDYQIGAEVVEGPLSSLKQLARQRLKPVEPLRLAAPSVNGHQPPSVYLLYDPVDEATAAPLQDWLFEQGIEVSFPDHGAEEEEAGRFHRATLCNCDAVLVYFGAVRRSWVETKLRALALDRDHAVHADRRAMDERTTPDPLLASYELFYACTRAVGECVHAITT